MKLSVLAAVGLVSSLVMTIHAQQTFTGTVSDSTCHVSHRSKAEPERLTDRQCVLACIKALSKYVLVTPDGQVMAIANQDAKGLPWYAGRSVRVTGEIKDNAIVISKIDAVANE